jgi:two-component system response regulator PilR (NtrC family)
MPAAPAEILVVDDQETNRKVITAILTREGYHIAAAADGREAMRLLRERTFDVVITDMLMPNADGLELITFIRGLEKRPAVIPMSGGGSYVSADNALELAKKMGAENPLPKPFTTKELRAAVVAALEHRTLQQG